MNPKILVFAGSIRAGSINEKLAAAAAEALAEAGAEVTHISLRDYDMPLYNGDLEAREGPPDAAKRLGALMMTQQGVFIAAPEYNAGMTPLLKNAIDWLSRGKVVEAGQAAMFKNRIFALGAASNGGFGGYRGLIQLRHTLELGLGTLVLPDMASVPAAASAFDEAGALTAERPAKMLAGVAGRLVEEARRLIGGTASA